VQSDSGRAPVNAAANSGLQPTRTAAFPCSKLRYHRVAVRAAEPVAVRRPEFVMWNQVTSAVGLLQVIDQKITDANARNGWFLPHFGDAQALLAFSDYSGEHRAASHEVITFVIASSTHLAEWEAKRRLVRHQHQLESRRMAYSKLGDDLKDHALRGFLASFDSLDAVVCSLAINKKITSVFDASGSVNFKEWGLESWNGWKPRPFEKMLRVTHLGSFLCAGLASEGQDLIWVTDDDVIAANAKRIQQVTAQFAHLLDQYLTRKLRHFRFATTAADTGLLDVEDMTSLPDLVGGAIADLFACLSASGARVTNMLTLLQPAGLPLKATQILSWLVGRPRGILVYAVEPGSAPGVIEITDAHISPHTVLHMPPRLGV